MRIFEIFNGANVILWSIITILLIICGVILSVRTGFFQFRGFFTMFKETFGKMFCKRTPGKVSPFAAMSTALCGTMGTGNIIGVGAALSLGGAGALFWMIISALLCMIIKYAEVFLAVKYRVKQQDGYKGGAMYYITCGISEKCRPLALFFCIATVFASFGIGAAAQSGAVSTSVGKVSGIPPSFCGIMLCILCACVIFGTAGKITKFTSYLVPIMTILYLFGAVYAIIKYYYNLPTALEEIFDGAFGSASSVGGGVAGSVISTAIRHGFSKGMFTNEAGMGSAPIAHASADNTPQNQGLYGMLEVFLDTVVMCSITGLVILVTNSSSAPADSMTFAAFYKVFGNFGGIFIALCVALFALGAAVGWNYYGSECCEYLFCKNPKGAAVYKCIYCAIIICSSVLPISEVLEAADFLNGLMALPNLYALIRLSGEVRVK